MTKRLFTSLAMVVGLLAATASIQADDWTSFWSVGNNVSVSFVRVDNSTYAWKFRNDGYRTISYMKFTYSYFDANSGQFRTDVDFLPGRLRPGDVVGGWAAFSANTRSQPRIQLVEVNYE